MVTSTCVYVSCYQSSGPKHHKVNILFYNALQIQMPMCALIGFTWRALWTDDQTRPFNSNNMNEWQCSLLCCWWWWYWDLFGRQPQSNRRMSFICFVYIWKKGNRKWCGYCLVLLTSAHAIHPSIHPSRQRPGDSNRLRDHYRGCTWLNWFNFH